MNLSQTSIKCEIKMKRVKKRIYKIIIENLDDCEEIDEENTEIKHLQRIILVNKKCDVIDAYNYMKNCKKYTRRVFAGYSVNFWISKFWYFCFYHLKCCNNFQFSAKFIKGKVLSQKFPT